MPEPVLMLLVAFPVLVAVVAAAAAWSRVTHPMLYLVVAVLALLGIQSVSSPAALGVLLPPPDALSRAAAHSAFIQSVATGAIAELLLGTPLLWWLYRGLRKAGKNRTGT